MRRFHQWPYVKRHWASKGIADIVCIRKSVHFKDTKGLCWLCVDDVEAQVVFIQCKYSRLGSAKGMLKKIDKKGLINYSRDCGAIPVYAYSENRRVKLVNLLTGKEFVP